MGNLVDKLLEVIACQERKGSKRNKYFSQNTETCGELVDKACGVVSLANCLRLLFPSALKNPTPLELISTCKDSKLFDKEGLSPAALYALCQRVAGEMTGVTVEMSSNGQFENLAPGSLMYVNSLQLLNAQGRKKVQTSKKDSHVVLVEEILPDETKTPTPAQVTLHHTHTDILAAVHIHT